MAEAGPCVERIWGCACWTCLPFLGTAVCMSRMSPTQSGTSRNEKVAEKLLKLDEFQESCGAPEKPLLPRSQPGMPLLKHFHVGN